jgi:NhaA family Na+:H+ antiporter
VPAITVNGTLYNGAWDEQALIEYIEYIKTDLLYKLESLKWGASAALMLLIAAIAALISNIGFSEEYEFCVILN